MSHVEEEDGKHEPIRGYPSLAKFIISDSSGKCAQIYRGFHELAARNLLHMQSQLAELETQQRAFDEEDWASEDLEGKARCRDWGELKTTADDASSDQRVAAQQWIELAFEIQAKLEKYHGSSSSTPEGY